MSSTRKKVLEVVFEPLALLLPLPCLVPSAYTTIPYHWLPKILCMDQLTATYGPVTFVHGKVELQPPETLRPNGGYAEGGPV